MGLLDTYGQHTLFLPTNEGVERFLFEQDSIYQTTKEPQTRMDGSNITIRRRPQRLDGCGNCKNTPYRGQPPYNGICRGSNKAMELQQQIPEHKLQGNR